ncbi:MAG: hypothetical protein ACKO9Q_09560, partial [Pirellula sp.]
ASSTNRNAIGTRVTTLAAQSSTGIYIQEADGVTIDLVNVSVDRVNFNSTKTAQSQTLEDLTTTNNGPVKLQSIAGDIVVNSGTTLTNGSTANGAGDILLEILDTGMIVTNSVVMSGSGNITLNSKDALNIVDLLRTGSPGTIYLRSAQGVTVENLQADNDIAVISGGGITLGRIDAGSGNVYLEAKNNVLDSDASSNPTNIIASGLAIKAGGTIGSSDLTNARDSNRNAIGTQVTTLAAQSANGIYVQEIDGVIIDTVTIGVKQVQFNSTLTDRAERLEDLVTTDNGPIKLQSLNGDIVVLSGTAGTRGIDANGSGDVLLQTVASGTIITQAQVRSQTGNITLNSPDDLTITD